MKKAKSGLNKIQELVQILIKLDDVERNALMKFCKEKRKHSQNSKLLKLIIGLIDSGNSVDDFEDDQEYRTFMAKQLGTDIQPLLRHLHDKIKQFIGLQERNKASFLTGAVYDDIFQIEGLVDLHLPSQAEVILLQLYKKIDPRELAYDRNLYVATKLLQWSHYFFHNGKRKEKHKEFLTGDAMQFYSAISNSAQEIFIRFGNTSIQLGPEQIRTNLQQPSFGYYEFLYEYALSKERADQLIKAIDYRLRSYNKTLIKAEGKSSKNANNKLEKYQEAYFIYLLFEKFVQELRIGGVDSAKSTLLQINNRLEFLTPKTSHGFYGLLFYFKLKLSELELSVDFDQYTLDHEELGLFTENEIKDIGVRVEINQMIYRLFNSKKIPNELGILYKELSVLERKSKGSMTKLRIKFLQFLTGYWLNDVEQMEMKLNAIKNTIKNNKSTPSQFYDWISKIHTSADDGRDKRSKNLKDLLKIVEDDLVIDPIKYLLIHWLRIELKL